MAYLPAGSGGLGKYIVVFDSTSTAAVQSMIATGLNLNSDNEYRILWKQNVAQNNGANPIQMFVNNDSTTTNYWVTKTTAYGIVTASTLNSPGIAVFSNLQQGAMEGYMIVDSASSLPVAIFNGFENKGVNMGYLTAAWQWTSTANVTSITFQSPVAGGIGINSRLTIFKTSPS